MKHNSFIFFSYSIVMETLLLVACFLITGCGSSTPPNLSPDTPTTNNTTTTATIPAVPVTQDTSEKINLTYYSKTETRIAQAILPSKTYTSTGYCLIYLGETYCWDDGIKVWQFTQNNFTFGPDYYSFFNMGEKNNGDYEPTGGGMTKDFMSSPIKIASNGNFRLNMLSATVDDVLKGTRNFISCTESENGNLDCGTFQVDVNQEAL